MNKKNSLLKARKSKKPVLVFSCTKYLISKIPHNYQIEIKATNKISYKFWYSPLELGIDFAKETAEEVIKKYFSKI
jgi:hypothetical protein